MSKTKLKHASYSIKKLMDKSTLAFETKANYQDTLKLCVKQLDSLGFQLDNINQLKQKHIVALTSCWKDQLLNIATMKNRLSTLRYACQLLNKSNLVQNNDYYEIGSRSYIPNQNKAIIGINLDKIADPFIRQSLELQQLFGLRREECLKLIPAIADKGDYLELKASWTKGGIYRTVPITNDSQRKCLDKAKVLCGKSSLIPKAKSFIEQRRLYDRLTHEAGFINLHGLRHAYAQQRYFELTQQLTQNKGWRAPLAGGKSRCELSVQEREVDKLARKMLSGELGHSRISIVKAYCG